MARKHPNLSALLDGTVWALSEDKLAQVGALLEKLGPDVVASETTEAFNNAHQLAVTVDQNGIATVPVEGVMMRRANLMMSLSGGTSTDILGTTLRGLADDPAVRGIILRVNSPGGTVDGISAVANAVEYADARKPFVALADSSALSGGMWLGSTARRFYATSDALVGSIGVVMSRTDISDRLAKEGIREHIFRAGRYKALGQASERLSDDELSETQKLLDNYYTLFVNHVAAHRGLAPEAVAETEARIYGAQDALSLNLIDAVKTYEDVLAEVTAEADAADALALAQTEMQSGFGVRDARITELAAENTDLKARLAAAEETLAKLSVETKAAQVEAAVAKLTEEGKVLTSPEAQDALRARLNADLDGTLATFAVVPVGAAAPANGPSLDASPAAPSADAVLADAAARGIPVVTTKRAAAIYDSGNVEYVDHTGATPVLRNAGN